VDRVPDLPKFHGIEGKLCPLLAAATAALLLISVALRLVQDVPFFRSLGPISDPVAAALITVEAVPLGIGVLLGVAAGVIAWLGWTRRFQNLAAISIVFGLVLAGGLFLGVRGYTPAEQVGWALVVLSAATLVAYLRASALES
jgi:hypothetical protein